MHEWKRRLSLKRYPADYSQRIFHCVHLRYVPGADVEAIMPSLHDVTDDGRGILREIKPDQKFVY